MQAVFSIPSYNRNLVRTKELGVIIPHLLFAHLMSDYVLQTSWLVIRKSQAWDGLLIHGATVAIISTLMLAPYLESVWLWMVILFGVHTAQDWLKVWLTPRLPLHLSYAYFADQVLHFGLILLMDAAVDIPTTQLEESVMAFGAALILVTRFYEVSWWANWFDMIVYMNRWEWWGNVERVLMLLAALVHPLIAPFFALPRLVYAWWVGNPLWKERYGLLEWGIGILFSVSVGYFGLFALIQ